jgi:anthranilate synthase/aminodeoxychorismate synthase-like glutamine amidotransferase
MKKLVLIDNYDSFTYNLYDYFKQLGVSCTVIKNDAIGNISKLNKYDGIIFSPGPKRPSDSPIMFDILAKYEEAKPILGICLGLQAIGEYYGATLVHANIPMHGKTSQVFHNNELFFNGIENPSTVMRYHSLILNIDKNDPNLEVIGITKDNEIMAIRHRKHPISGVQFHPESILTKDGLIMLRNWVESM